jgi:hypothetical protein
MATTQGPDRKTRDPNRGGGRPPKPGTGLHVRTPAARPGRR